MSPLMGYGRGRSTAAMSMATNAPTTKLIFAPGVIMAA